MSTFDKWFAKTLVIGALLIFFMPMFFLLNMISAKNLWVFIAIIFGCNVLYDATKRIISSQIFSFSEWLTVINFAWSGIALIALSYVGLYIDIFVFKYVGIGLIWFPCFFLGIIFIGKAEKAFKVANNSILVLAGAPSEILCLVKFSHGR
ncbi:hypothetical protein [Paraglaciecola sp.]|uniref:hypothetical protein n=1 Tax=Paraglaciecola sp. TaxID=1920173 RepID=UPI00326488C1